MRSWVNLFLIDGVFGPQAEDRRHFSEAAMLAEIEQMRREEPQHRYLGSIHPGDIWTGIHDRAEDARDHAEWRDRQTAVEAEHQRFAAQRAGI